MKRQRLYALYRRKRAASRGSRWERHPAYPTWAFTLERARRAFQTLLIQNAVGAHDPEWEYRLLPARDDG